ncbi:Haem peroxidase,Haem peroxidase, animal type [Cinara cedri]|uniref:Haem peroxidase,Haem peroxidase, animal type n=1 Tax=Cinara cedri TaxID=506608 RepID=A0A5E4M7G9_9HEMI|nr:Haem peroxidase,Haem peroxidase, animal type [Cinara cedri]
MNWFSGNNENKPLLNKAKTNLKNNRTWILRAIFLSILLLGVLYLLFVLFKGEAESNNVIKTTKNPLHISSKATTNDNYLIQCAPRVKCDPNVKYRSINGSCNNLYVPTRGAAKTSFLRLLDANYNDGHYDFRRQTNGSKLPNPRIINIKLFLSREIYRLSENNVLLLPFGQLIAHDISGLPNDVPRTPNDVIIDCCTDDNARKTFAQCQLIVEDPPDDPVYSKHNITCMGVTRSMTSMNYSCPLSPTTFININTQFIDASEVYGSNESISRYLRVMEGGRLKFTTNNNGEMFCPIQKKKQYEPIQLQTSNIQYETGDPDNGNQNLGITAIQTLFLRYHNYLAFQLSALNPYWSDEILYQESRRIVIATIQRIVYNDFLPIIIGQDFQEIYGINEENIYDPTVDPSMAQELSSAAIRVLHTIIPVQFNFMSNEYNIDYSINITDWMANPDLLPIGNNFDKLFKGFLETPGRITQPSYNFFISNYMFSFPKQPAYTGLDLLSIDIARGRDVGLQPYNQVRHLCGRSLANDFDDLVDLIHIKDINTLKELYHSVNDIDLMVGLLLEKLSDGAIVGPTAQCLIADGFYRFKVGDRFFYDVQGQPGSFTPDQLKEIKKITLGHVICATSNVDHVQKDIFKTIDHKSFPTSKMKCGNEFYIDLTYWKEPSHHSDL